jgi:hypothetical protein
VLLPLYAISAAFAVRSGIFDLSDKNVSAEEYKALWAFLASGFATAITLIGLLLTRSHNERVADQLTLDVAVKGLELIIADGKYSPPARIAGALAALVHLGHPVIAMRVLDAAWDDNAVDTATGCWLIGEVLERGSPTSVQEAARLLRTHASRLCGNEEQMGKYEWPAPIYEDWPKQIPREAKTDILQALFQLLISRERAWWIYGFHWAIVLLYVVIREETDVSIKTPVAKALKILLTSYEDEDDSVLFRRSTVIPVFEIRRTAERQAGGLDLAYELDDYIPRLQTWVRASEERPWSAEGGRRPPAGRP